MCAAGPNRAIPAAPDAGTTLAIPVARMNLRRLHRAALPVLVAFAAIAGLARPASGQG